MPDHSLLGSLKRRTTEELDAMLVYCLQEENYANHEHVILEVLSILCERDAQEATIKG